MNKMCDHGNLIKSFVVVIALVLLFLLSGCSGSAWQEHYDLGIQYLNEGKYEEAIIEFTAAIEIDTKKSDAYYGRGKAYYSTINLLEKGETAEFLADIQDEAEKRDLCYMLAIADLKKAIEVNPSEAEYYDAIMEVALKSGDIDLMLLYAEMRNENIGGDGDLKDLYEAAKLSVTLMDKLAAAFDEKDDEAIFSLMQSDNYQMLLFLQVYMDRPILREYGTMSLGLYRIDDPEYGNCMIYYGECLDSVRSGTGAWYGYNDGNNFASNGEWAGDAPNGNFSTKEWYSGLNEDVVYRIISGDVLNGLWNGEVVWAFDRGAEYESWNCTFADGVGQIVNESEHDDGTIFYEWSQQTNEGKDVSLGANAEDKEEKHGIPGFK